MPTGPPRLGSPKFFTWHHSASNRRNTTYKMVERWHKSRFTRGFGYHYFIGDAGRLEYGKDFHVLGTHTGGGNYNNLGVCVAGDNTQESERWLNRQLKTLRTLTEALLLVNPKIAIGGHKDWKATACPGLDVRDVLDSWGLRGEVYVVKDRKPILFT